MYKKVIFVRIIFFLVGIKIRGFCWLYKKTRTQKCKNFLYGIYVRI